MKKKTYYIIISLFFFLISNNLSAQDVYEKLYQLTVNSIREHYGKAYYKNNKKSVIYISKNIELRDIEDQKYCVFRAFPKDSINFTGNFIISNNKQLFLSENSIKQNNLEYFYDYDELLEHCDKYLYGVIYFSNILFVNNYAFLRVESRFYFESQMYHYYLFERKEDASDWELINTVSKFAK